MSNLDDFFSSWKDISASAPKKSGQWENKLKLEIGNKYLVRFLPYLKEGKAGYHKTTFQFITYAWKSVVDGRWIYALSPRTWGESCPISNFYFKAKESEDPVVQEKLKKLSFKRGCYYNVYVVSDPTNPDNEGKVKILQASKQLNDVISASISDDPEQIENNKEELGVENLKNAMFDLSPNGINLSIEVQDQGGFANYKTSKFVRRNRDLGLSDEQIEEIHDQVFDLTKIDQRRTPEEIEELFNTTFLGLKPANKGAKETKKVVVPSDDVEKSVSEPEHTEKPAGKVVSIDELDAYLSENSTDDE